MDNTYKAPLRLKIKVSLQQLIIRSKKIEINQDNTNPKKDFRQRVDYVDRIIELDFRYFQNNGYAK